MNKAPEKLEKIKNSDKSDKKVHSAVFAAILGAAVILLVFGGVAAMLFSPQAPKMLVNNQTLVIDENALFTYEINRYPSGVQISNVTEKNITIGFALTPGSINFGVVPTGGNAGKRFITLQNTAVKPSKITLKAYGNIAPMVKFSDNNFLLSKDAPKPIEIILETKNGTLLGNYSGEIDIIVKKPKYSFAAKLL